VIERVELTLIELKPKVKRTDAIQSFTAQETPIVRVFDRDGARVPAATPSAPAALISVAADHPRRVSSVGCR
jgi:hypothetical protein